MNWSVLGTKGYGHTIELQRQPSKCMFRTKTTFKIPGIVTYASKTEPAYSFDHYVVASDAEYPNKATWVKAEFWVSLPCTTLLNTSHFWTFLEIMNGYIAFV